MTPPFQLLVAYYCWLIIMGDLAVVVLPTTATALLRNNDGSDDEASKKTRPEEEQSRRPIMYTYFENLSKEHDFSGMSLQDHQDMLQFWNLTWSEAGWEPIILTREDVVMNDDDYNNDDDFISIMNKKYHDGNHTQQLLSAWSKMLLSRWMAVAQKGGGWYCDYDVFPLYSYSELLLLQNKTSLSASSPSQEVVVAVSNVLTLHEVVAPTLVSGSASAWRDMAQALMEHALHDVRSGSSIHNKQAKTSFWTDTLALLDIRHEGLLNSNKKRQLRRKNESLWFPELRTVRHVVQADRVMDLLLLPSTTTTADDVTSGANRCSSSNNSPLRKIKKQQWVIHFGPLTLQRAPNLPTGIQRIPSHRLQLARAWMQQWWECHQQAQRVVER